MRDFTSRKRVFKYPCSIATKNGLAARFVNGAFVVYQDDGDAFLRLEIPAGEIFLPSETSAIVLERESGYEAMAALQMALELCDKWNKEPL